MELGGHVGTIQESLSNGRLAGDFSKNAEEAFFDRARWRGSKLSSLVLAAMKSHLESALEVFVTRGALETLIVNVVNMKMVH